MIIKIRKFKSNLTNRMYQELLLSKEGTVYEGWWIEDGIAKISISEVDVPVGITPSWMEGVDCYLPFPEVLQQEKGVGKAIQLICRMKDGGERVLVFQGDAFLLNDDGKTIERLVA